jgi:hypothetical protein
MRVLYSCKTTVGTFYISQSDDGRFHPIFKDESYGSYAHAWQAAEDLAGGHVGTIPGVRDVSALGIPADHTEWERTEP